MTAHTIRFGVSNSAECSCGATFRAAHGDDLDFAVGSHLGTLPPCPCGGGCGWAFCDACGKASPECVLVKDRYDPAIRVHDYLCLYPREPRCDVCGVHPEQDGPHGWCGECGNCSVHCSWDGDAP